MTFPPFLSEASDADQAREARERKPVRDVGRAPDVVVVFDRQGFENELDGVAGRPGAVGAKPSSSATVSTGWSYAAAPRSRP